MNYKKEILTVAMFVENRPDMAIHTDSNIQSCIFACAGLLNSETNGMIEQVWDFNAVDPEFSKDNPLYRTKWELDQIVEAFISQTQYMLNLGNDMTQGGGSYSIGNINTSYSRPIDRDTIAPGVKKLLQNARVYQLQDFFNAKKTNTNDDKLDPYNTQYITRSIGDKRYVNESQPNATPGHVAVVGQDNLITFANPFGLSFGFYNATRIKQWNSNDYVDIDKVNDLAFFGENLYGFKSAVQRGEIMQMVTNLNTTWNKDFPYIKNNIVILTYVINETRDANQDWKMAHFLCLKDNVGVYPLNDTTGTWERLETAEIDVNKIIDIVYDKVVEKYDIDFSDLTFTLTKRFDDLQFDIDSMFGQLKNEIKNEYIPNELDKLPAVHQVMYHKGQSYTFKDKASFDLIKVEYNIQDVDYEIVENGSKELVSNQTKPTGEKIVLQDGTTREIMCKNWTNIKPFLADGKLVIFPNKLYTVISHDLYGDLLSPNIVEFPSPPTWDHYVDQRGTDTKFVLNTAGYPQQNNTLGLNVYYYANAKANDFVGDTSNWNVPFYTITFLKDITKKQLTKVVEQNEITIKEDAQTSNFDRTITLKDFANDLTQDIKIENNGVVAEQIPLNYMMSENETWTGKYYRESATEIAKKVYHFNKKLNLNVAVNVGTALPCLYDADKLVNIIFTMSVVGQPLEWMITPNFRDIQLYKQNNEWMLMNSTTNTITIKSINVEYTKKDVA